MEYKKGLHIVCDLEDASEDALCNMDGFKTLVEGLILKHQLQSTGSVYHHFELKGYTAVVGLTESHLSVHTWPEFGRVTYDIFLSNFLQVNDSVCEHISKEIQTFFGGKVSQIHKLSR
ncbi:MAG: S-adenosylmethionine decarboxylase [Bacteroidetes bacterium B1(2017)]|nr:MAG: S-adenosylmethionine decarboxylase [Bacteroidetes bacterium B1(2017)]